MALKRNGNGQYIVKTKAEAQRAIIMMQNLQNEIEEIEKREGLDEMKQDAVELKKAATAFVVNSGADSLAIPSVRKVAKLIRAVNKKLWIGTKADMAELAELDTAKVKPLRSLVTKEVWMQITTRIPDPAKIDEAVAEGVITAKQIEPAYVETFKAPYLGITDA